MRARTRTWRIGGILLGVSGLLTLLGPQFPPGGPFLRVLIDLAWAAGVLVFAFGLSRTSSVVARRPLGLSALVVVAVLPVAVNAGMNALPTVSTSEQQTYIAVSIGVTYTAVAVSIAAGLIASVQIARLGAVPPKWRWAPMWALIVSVGAATLVQVLWTVLDGLGAAQEVMVLGGLVGTVGSLAPTLGLGIVALLAAADQRPDSVEVYRSA